MKNEILGARPSPEGLAEELGTMTQALINYMLIRTSDLSLAEDLAEETILKAFENLPRYQDRGNPFVCWVFKIAHNQFVDHYRKSKKTNHVSFNNVAYDKTYADETDHQDPYEIRNLIEDIAKLPCLQRNILILRICEELPYEDIGEIVEKSATAVKVDKSRGVLKLRKMAKQREEAINTKRLSQGYAPLT